MALINCPECNKEISSTCKKCIHCGYKFKKDKKRKIEISKGVFKKILIFLCLLGVIAFVLYNFSPITFKWLCKHNVKAATCEEDSKCSRCGEFFGTKLGHSWIAANCTVSKTCTRCGIEEGEPLGHSWGIPTCTRSEECSNCGKTRRKALGHNVVDYKCSRCKETFVNADEVKEILDITTLQYEVNYVGGVDIYMNVKNKSKTKTIDYITYEIEFYNAVGDVLKDDVTHDSSTKILFTGPLGAGKSSGKKYWRACFYNSTFSGTINFKSIEIEYSDGTSLILKESIADETVVDWR